VENFIAEHPVESAVTAVSLLPQGAVVRGVRGVAAAGRDAVNAVRLRNYLNEMRKIPKGVREVGKSQELLTDKQKKSLHTLKKKGSSFKSPEITNFSNGSAMYTVKVPARNVRGSYRIYEKHVDANGKTIKMDAITIGPNGELVHVKTK